MKPSNDGTDYLQFSTVSDIPTVKSVGGIDLDIVSGTAGTMRLNVEDGTNWFTYGTTTSSGGYQWTFNNKEFRVYANNDASYYTTFSTKNSMPRIATANINATNNITAEYFCINKACTSYITHNGTHTIIQT